MSSPPEQLAAALGRWSPEQTSYKIPEDVLLATRHEKVPFTADLIGVVRAVACEQYADLEMLVANPGKASDSTIAVALTALPLCDSVVERRAFYKYVRGVELNVGPFAGPESLIPPVSSSSSSRLSRAGRLVTNRLRKQDRESRRDVPFPATTSGSPRDTKHSSWWSIEHIISSTSSRDIDLWWSRLVPSILALVDHADVSMRAQGCRLVVPFTRKYEAKVKSAGLDTVFWDAVIPSLSYIPPLVPPGNTITVHDPAVRALIVLAGMSCGDNVNSMRRQHFIVTEGCIKALRHTGGSIDVILAFTATLRYVCEVSPVIVAHAGELIECLVAILIDPFIVSARNVVEAITLALAEVCQHSWPRIFPYRYDIVHGLLKADAVGIFFDKLELTPAPDQRNLKALCEVVGSLSQASSNSSYHAHKNGLMSSNG